MKHFIGLTFYPNYLQFKKIDSFRRRFDWKYSRSTTLQMTVLAPFELTLDSKQKYHSFIEHLEEDIDTHLSGIDEPLNVAFNGFDFQQGNKPTLYLKPDLPIDIGYCVESLTDLIKDFGGQFNKKRNRKDDDLIPKTVLPIGRFLDEMMLGAAIDTARIEFSSPFQLMARDLTLFEKVPGQWIAKKKLFTFSDARDNLSAETDFSQLKTPANF